MCGRRYDDIELGETFCHGQLTKQSGLTTNLRDIPRATISIVQRLNVGVGLLSWRSVSCACLACSKKALMRSEYYLSRILIIELALLLQV